MNIRGTVVSRYLSLCDKADFDIEQRAQVLKTLAMVSDKYIELCHEDYVAGNQSMAVGFNMYGTAEPFMMLSHMNKLEE